MQSPTQNRLKQKIFTQVVNSAEDRMAVSNAQSKSPTIRFSSLSLYLLLTDGVFNIICKMTTHQERRIKGPVGGQDFYIQTEAVKHCF